MAIFFKTVQLILFAVCVGIDLARRGDYIDPVKAVYMALISGKVYANIRSRSVKGKFQPKEVVFACIVRIVRIQ